jgi:hypothetical protein
MKIEYLAEGSKDCPLIRIYGGDASAFNTLKGAVLGLSRGAAIRVALDEALGFDRVNDCCLTLAVGPRDEGVCLSSPPAHFLWTLTRQKWHTVAGYIEPFTRQVDNTAYQWLCGREAREGLDVSDIGVLISRSAIGQW